MDTVFHDIRYAARRLLKSPGFTLIVAATLALGIGATSAIFSVVNGVLLRSLPFPDAGRLVGVFHESEGRRSTVSPANFRDARAQNRSLVDLAAYYDADFTITGSGDPARLEGVQTSAGFFDVLGVRPVLGRTFHAEENTPGKHRVVVLGHALWRQRFGGDPDVVGRTVTLDGNPYTVIGVMPRGFSFPAKRELWAPIEYDSYFAGDSSRGAWYLRTVGRLKPGVSAEQAATDVAAIGRRLAAEYPQTNIDVGMALVPLHDAIVGDVRPALRILLGAVALVLLIACANVANLLLARGAAREGEMAVRTALGAGRGRLVRQLLTESVLLSLLGGALGLLLAVWGVDALVALQPRDVPRLQDVRVDVTVVAVTAGVALLTGLLFGLVPAFQLTRTHLAASLKEGGRGALAGRGGSRLRGTLVAAEMALAVVLLAGAGLLLKSFVRLQRVDPGFRPEQALAFSLSLPETTYGDDEKVVSFYDRLLERVHALPGARSAGGITYLPLSGSNFNISFEVEGRPPAAPGEGDAMEVRVVTPRYFEAMGIPLRRGRLFVDGDDAASPQVALLSETGARRFFPNEDPIGKRIKMGWGRGAGKPRVGGVVVGIVGDVKIENLAESDQPEVYYPHHQVPVHSLDMVVRTAGDPLALAGAVQREVRALDPNLPITGVRTVEQLVAESVSQPRFYMLLLSIFAAVALTLAAVGILGVMSYSVAQRTREIGVRVALGARQGALLWLVVRQAMLLALVGVGVGLVGALALSRTLAGLLYDLSPMDPLTYGGVALLLAAVALLASYVPARRATRVDPMVALRYE